MIEGDMIKFGSYGWRILSVENDKMLIMTEDIIEQRAYHDAYEATTWANCELRHYLNNGFYNRFTLEEQSRIVPVTNENKANPWYDSTSGEDTLDKIFLLDVEEVVCKYFGDSSANLHNRGKNQKYWFQRKDSNNAKRSARFRGGIWWWWLRSPGRLPVKAVYVHGDGNIGIQGNNIFKCNISLFHSKGDNKGGVRPALWLWI